MRAKPLAQGALTEAQVRQTLLYAKGSRVDEVRLMLVGATGDLKDISDLMVQGSGAIDYAALAEIPGKFDCSFENRKLTLIPLRDRVLKDKPILYWQFRNTSASDPVLDQSGSGIHGTIGAGVTVKQNSLCKDADDFSFRFPGTAGGFVSAGHNAAFNFTTKFTIEILIQTVAVQLGVLLIRSGQMSLVINANGTLTFTASFTSGSPLVINTESAFNDGEAYDIRVTYDGQFMRLYADYALLAEVAETRSLAVVTQPLSVGGNYAGLIDELSIYNRQMTEYQGRLHYQCAFKDDSPVIYGYDEVKPYYGTYVGDTLVEWAMGVFALTTPEVQGGEDFVSVTGFDRMIYLIDDTFPARHFVPSGTPVIAEVISIILSAGLRYVNIEPSSAVTTKDLEFPLGSNKKLACNQLLASIGYYALYPDYNGVISSEKYLAPEARPVDIVYNMNELSIITPKRTIKNDFSKIPNQVIGYTGAVDGTSLSSVARNTSVKSAASIYNRRRTITEVLQTDAVDQTALDLAVAARLDRALQKSRVLTYGSLPYPVHTHLNKIRVIDSKLGMDETFIETGYRIPLLPGGEMLHTWRKVEDLS